MKNLLAYADESGNNSFDFEKQSTHFIIAAIIIKKENVSKIENEIEQIRKKYFQTGEMKSSKVGDNHQRRLKVLNEISKVDFSIYAIVVDKRELFSEGFKYKGSFYKFLNRLAYTELFRAYPDLHLMVDEHGSNDFMRGFKKYILKHHVMDLFTESDFNFIQSPQSVLIQLADFIAGTLGRYYDESKKSEFSSQFLEVLKPKIASLDIFPLKFQSSQINIDENERDYHKVIADFGLRKAMEFIDTKKVISQEDSDQIACLKVLMLYFRVYDYKKYISTKEIINHLQIGRKEPLNEHYFRTKIIAKLRDSGVLITSNSAGYKLPSSTSDLYKFIQHGNSVISPMISRIKKCRDSIKLATNNEIDILDRQEFKNLRIMLELVD
ncbi:hypothetical protein GCM10011514_25760 [Emticicia aquatilis]|uniref:DUF3800 domain-containing protein n=1 Tax=Emticicia aquatilis TaxID=1537369 RepID=A0A916YU79_9BACT|nr:DUF3800 domain-containing protein [Emticicia aquatilis]GGD60664.1 hypothetical protein GCM10011514_25760 [Emticicia aquatilis]